MMCSMHTYFFGEVRDIVPDGQSGRRTTATQIGTVRAKFMIAAFLFIESVLVHHFFRDAVISGFLGAGALWFVLDATVLGKDRAYTPPQMRLFMFAWPPSALLGLYSNFSTPRLAHARHHVSLYRTSLSM